MKENGGRERAAEIFFKINKSKDMLILPLNLSILLFQHAVVVPGDLILAEAH